MPSEFTCRTLCIYSVHPFTDMNVCKEGRDVGREGEGCDSKEVVCLHSWSMCDLLVQQWSYFHTNTNNAQSRPKVAKMIQASLLNGYQVGRLKQDSFFHTVNLFAMSFWVCVCGGKVWSIRSPSLLKSVKVKLTENVNMTVDWVAGPVRYENITFP